LQTGTTHAVFDLRRHISGELDHLHEQPFRILDWVVGCLNPDRPATFAEPLVFGGLILTAPEHLPKRLISRTVSLVRLDEHAVMVALDLVQTVTNRLEEIVVRGDDATVGIEFDHGL
jgi:hypothetical protein